MLNTSAFTSTSFARANQLPPLRLADESDRDLLLRPVLAAVDDRGRSRVRHAAHFGPAGRAILCLDRTRLYAFRYVRLIQFSFLILIARPGSLIAWSVEASHPCTM
jgi:hypothetical protein